MKLNKRKLTAWIILLAAYIFPFRYAFFTPEDTGFKSMLNFLFVVAAVLIFAILYYKDEPVESKN